MPSRARIVLSYATLMVLLAVTLFGVWIEATVRSVGRTGVEMEALTAVTVGLLTVYDMVKAAGHGMEISQIRLLEKTGGTTGDWKREDEAQA